jgi:hypothetical protein
MAVENVVAEYECATVPGDKVTAYNERLRETFRGRLDGI